MSPRSLIWICVMIGSAVGGFIPALWGDGMFSMSSSILSVVGGLIGIWIGFKLSQMF